MSIRILSLPAVVHSSQFAESISGPSAHSESDVMLCLSVDYWFYLLKVLSLVDLAPPQWSCPSHPSLVERW